MPRRPAAPPAVPVVPDFASPDFPEVLAAATAELARRDPVLARLVAAVGPCDLDRRAGLPHFGALCRSIVFQQLAGRAASVIFGRFVAAVTGGGEAVDITPEGVMAVPAEALRGAGLSTAKTRTIRGLAEATLSGEVPLHDVERLGDEELIARLSTVPGIGRWTAEMFLMFQLGRLDIWPVGDLGVRKGYARAWGLPDLPAPKELIPLGEPFRPWRTVAAWYCWRVVDTVVPGSAATPPTRPGAAPETPVKAAAAKKVPARKAGAEKRAPNKPAAKRS